MSISLFCSVWEYRNYIPLLFFRLNFNLFCLRDCYHHFLEYVVCNKIDYGDQIDQIFMWVIIGWKLVQLLFGLIVALMVSRISLQYIRKFNETSVQILSILFTAAIVVLATVLYSGQSPTLKHLIIACCGLLISNMVLAANMFPRLWAICRGKEDEFTNYCEEEMSNLLKKALLKKSKMSVMDLLRETELESLHAKHRMRRLDSESERLSVS